MIKQNKKRKLNNSVSSRSELKKTHSRMLINLFGFFGTIGVVGIPVLGYLSLGPVGLGLGISAAGLTCLAFRKCCL